MFPVLILAAALSAGNADFDRTAAEGAAQITFARTRKELVKQGPAEGVLRKAMLEDPARFKVKSEAEDYCREIFMGEVVKAYLEKCAEIRKGLSLPDTFAVDFSEAERTTVDEKFPAVFVKERREAVAEQAKGIMSTTRPSEAEFESKTEDELRKEMVARVIAEQTTPVFEENADYISEQIVNPVLQSGKAERKRQGEYLMRVRSEAVSPSRLASELKERLEKNVTERAKKETAARAWGVFPSVINVALPDAVERRTLDRLVTQIENTVLDVSAETVLKVIEQNPEAHLRKKDSEALFGQIYAEQIRYSALAKALEKAPVDERDELHEFLSRNIKADLAEKAIAQVVRRDVMIKWRKARGEAAVLQANATWPMLGDKTWFPNPELADATAARSDYAAALKKWRDFAGMETLAEADKEKIVMEEASECADLNVAAAFDLARSAIAAQNAIVDKEHESLLNALKEKGDKPSVKSIAENLRQLTEENWTESRVNTLWPDGKKPANADEQHTELFPSVRRKIELLAKSILEELNEPQPEEEKKPEEPPPEEPKPEDPQPEEPPEELLEFSISVSRKGDDVEVKLLKGDSPVYEKKVDGRFSSFESAMKELSLKLGRDLLHLK